MSASRIRERERDGIEGLQNWWKQRESGFASNIFKSLKEVV